MKKLIRKGISIFIALALMVCLVPVNLITHVKANTIDETKKGSITIHKYDITAANKKGINTDNYLNNGEADSKAETELSDYAIKGVVFTYLKVADVITDTEETENGNSVRVLYGFNDEKLLEMIGLDKTKANQIKNGKYYFNSTDIVKALKNKLENSNTETKDKLEYYIRENNGTDFDETDNTGLTSVKNLDLGLYLIVETYVPEDVTFTTDPFFIQLPMTSADGSKWMYDVNVYPKNQTDVPTLDKKVADDDDYSINGNNGHKLNDTATISEGDIADYRITSKLPEIKSKASYLTKYTFVDKLSSKGLVYNKDSVELHWYESKEDAENNNTDNAIANWKQSDDKFNLDFNENTMTISMTEKGLREINPSYNGCYVVIAYNITVKSTADLILGDEGNPNTVRLTYSRTNTKYEETMVDEAIVYSYGIDLTKVFSDGNGDMSKVKFILRNASRKTDDKTNAYYVIADKLSDGEYYVSGETTDKEKATEFIPNKNGKINIYGIEAGKYELSETATDSDYSLLGKNISIEIKKTEADLTASSVAMRGEGQIKVDVVYSFTANASSQVDGVNSKMSEYNGSKNAITNVKVNNERKFLIPQTGAAGTFMITIGGLMLVVFGLAMGRKKNTDNE